MAKKKTENIKAAPVLRAQSGGEQPEPEQTGTRTYQIMDLWKDKDVVNLVDVKAVDGEITEVKVNGQPAGGGGGDSSLVSVTIINDLNISILPDNYNVSTILTDMSESWELPAGTVKYPKEMWEGPSITAGNRYTVQNIVLVSNGNALITFNITGATYSVSGSITEVAGYKYGHAFLVAGPGTIKLS